MSNTKLPISIQSSVDPLETIATIYEDYYTGELRFCINTSYLVEKEFEEVVKAYNFIKYGTGPE